MASDIPLKIDTNEWFVIALNGFNVHGTLKLGQNEWLEMHSRIAFQTHDIHLWKPAASYVSTAFSINNRLFPSTLNSTSLGFRKKNPNHSMGIRKWGLLLPFLLTPRWLPIASATILWWSVPWIMLRTEKSLWSVSFREQFQNGAE